MKFYLLERLASEDMSFKHLLPLDLASVAGREEFVPRNNYYYCFLSKHSTLCRHCRATCDDWGRGGE